MTPLAKKSLADTVQALRARLLVELHEATESAYRLSIPRAQDAHLDEAARVRRGRLERHVAEQVRGAVEAELTSRRRPDWDEDELAAQRRKIETRLRAEGLPARVRREVEASAAYTLLNRLVILRLVEEGRQPSERVLTGGWNSGGYREFRTMNPALVQGEETEGYGWLLRMVFEDLAIELPGLYGPTGAAELVPVPARTLRAVVEALDAKELAECWNDDMTLGWVFQYWNDPEREALDAKLNNKGKLERHEIASKTQMFTERYMVDWLLQNSLGPMWFVVCRRHGWEPAAQADGTLDRLEARRAEWRKKREAGEVELTDLMLLRDAAEARWAYYVPQSLPEDAKDTAPASVRDLRLLDPAVGSGHFLVVAFDLLLALYREEARHRGADHAAGRAPAGGLGWDPAQWTDRAAVERILEHNLHGIDLDPRAVQIAAAALWLKAKQACEAAQPKRLNLVASALRLASLPDSDPALVELRHEVSRETGIPGELTDTLVHALRGADHLGSLLRVDKTVDEALTQHEADLSRAAEPTQIGLPGIGAPAPQQLRIAIGKEEARKSVLDRIEEFLGRHTGGDDLGLRLRGEQLAAGVRFVRMLREGTYDLVVGNPPYQGTAKMADATYVKNRYPRGKADLYAAFLERGLQLARPGGTSALLTMRNWMFIKQYVELRTWLLQTYDLRALGDFAIGAFEYVPNDVLSVVGSVFRKAPPAVEESVALQPTPPDDRSYDRERTARKRAAVLAGVGRIDFAVSALSVIRQLPLVYWWGKARLAEYARSPKLGEQTPIKVGLASSGGVRFSRFVWEVKAYDWSRYKAESELPQLGSWLPIVRGAKGKAWIEPLETVLDWHMRGFEAKVLYDDAPGGRVVGEEWYLTPGISYPKISHDFTARRHRYRSVFGDAACTAFPTDHSNTVCLMNSRAAARVLEEFNPTPNFQVGDVERLPLFPIANADDIFATVERAFGVHEAHREASVEFKRPGPSPWRHAQDWAQRAVDRPEGAPLPPYEEELDQEPPADHVSYAVGVALGRFGPRGEGVLDPRPVAAGGADLSHALPAGILFLDGTLDPSDTRDGLGHPAAAPIRAAWEEHGHRVAKGTPLRDWLREGYFALHKSARMYDSRPIHWPLSSKKKTFVAWVTIHRWTARTLRDLLAEHLYPTQARLSGEADDLRAVRDGADKRAAREADKRLAKLRPSLEELESFIAAVEQCAERGAPPTDAGCAPREVDATYLPDLDDGVMINAAALWPLLATQWKDPAKWWKELASPTDKKHLDWAHLAMRYWPTRVDARCKTDPSLAVAHGCFWAYHPARAWKWELQLQDEIGPTRKSPPPVGGALRGGSAPPPQEDEAAHPGDAEAEPFLIEEAPYRGDGGHTAHRAAWLRDHPKAALAAVYAEAVRRRRKKKTPQAELRVYEPGLWGPHARACWDVELDVIDVQGQEFRLVAPDEPAARAALLEAHPELVTARLERLEKAQQRLKFTPPEQADEAEATDEDAGDEPGDEA